VRFPCVHAVATTPAQRLGILFARFPNRISLPGKGCPVGLRNDLFEACSAFTHITACTLAGSPKATPYIGGSSHFVTSMTAPIASGRSDLAGWDFHPLEKRRLITAHTHCCHSDMDLSFPIAVIGKVALSTLVDIGAKFPNGNFPAASRHSTLGNQLALLAKRSNSNKKVKVTTCDLNPYHSPQLIFALFCV